MRKSGSKTSQELSKGRSRNKLLPVTTYCRNCNTKLYSRYCHNCGQDLFAGRERTLRAIIYNAFDSMFAFDNKILKTFKSLVFSPGKLTTEYLSGHIVKYMPPAKLFWAISIIFFFFFSISLQTQVKTQENTPTPMSVDVSVENSNRNETGNEINEKVFIETSIRYLPYAILLLTPLFALLLRIAYRKNVKYYADHMVFSLHFHSFLFIALGMITIAYNSINSSWIPWGCLYSLIPLIYFVIASKRVYNPKIWSLIKRTIFVVVLYLFVMIVFMILFIITILSIFYPELISG